MSNEQRAAEVPPWGDDVVFGEICRRDARLRDQIAEVIAEWMAAPNKPEDWQRANADDLTADVLPYVHAYADAAEARGRAEVLARVRAPETDEMTRQVAAQYRDPTLAFFAINDFRDALVAALSPAVTGRADEAGAER